MENLLSVFTKVAEAEGITIGALERKLGASKGVLSRAINKGTDVQSKWFLSLVENYPHYDYQDLMGLLNNESNVVNEKEIRYFDNKNSKNLKIQKVPLYNLKATAGLVPLFNDPQALETQEFISIPHLPKSDGAIYVTGDSMYPILKSGDMVVYKKVSDFKNDIFWGEMYLISIEVGDEEYISVKYIQKSEIGPDHIKLVSHNKNHQDKDVPIDKIRALAYVKASIRINSIR